MIIWRILRAENSSSDNATDTSGTDKSRRAQSSLPLASDVVGLPGENSWHIGVTGGDGDKDTKVANCDVVKIPKKGKTWDVQSVTKFARRVEFKLTDQQEAPIEEDKG